MKTPSDAAALNLAPLAGPYDASEIALLNGAIASLGAIRHTVVVESDGLHLWRDKTGMKIHVTAKDE